MACVRELSDNDLSWRQGIGFVTHKPQSFAQPRPIIIYSPRQLKCYQSKPTAKTNNVCQDVDNFRYNINKNRIQILLYYINITLLFK
jgi:hypothetical protein